MGFTSAWLVSLYSSAGSGVFAVPMLDMGKVRASSFSKSCVR